MAPSDPQSTTRSRSSRPLVLATVCLLAGLGAGLIMNHLSGGTDDQVASSEAAEEAALAAIQDKLLNTLILPTNFKSVPEFSLLDVNGDEVTQSLFNDHWSIVFFGFTHCPDVCPITLSVMKDVLAQLHETDLPKPQTVFVSVDPKRDTPDVLKTYLGYFDESFKGVTGELTGILNMSRALGVVAAFTAKKDDPENYDVDHTASMLLISPSGQLRAKFSAPHSADAIVSDYMTLMSVLGPTRSAKLMQSAPNAVLANSLLNPSNENRL